MNLPVFTCAVIAFLLYFDPAYAAEKEDIMVEQTTESPITDIALVDNSMKAEAVKAGSAMNTATEPIKKVAGDSQQHTIADFIIHPLIALKPRVPETASGKQADTSSTTPSPWQLFGFNAGQGLGSSVSSLAGTVTGWLGNRIQLPGFVDTPVRESSTTFPTTERPDVVIRVKQRTPTKKPLISISNKNDRPFRKNKRRNNFNSNNFYESEESFDSDEYDDGDEDFNRRRVNRRRYQEDNYDEYFSTENDDDENSVEGDERDDDNEANHDFEEEAEDDDERPINYNRQKHITNHKRRLNNIRRKQPLQQEDSTEQDQHDDENEYEEFYYSKNQDSKRSKNEPNFIQRSQQSLLNQIKHLTRVQSPAEEGNSLRKYLKSNNKKRRQQTTLLITRNGDTIYVAPELLQVADDTSSEVNVSSKKRLQPQFPQPPLTVPYRKKGQPTQYITIPWSQLGISPPDQVTSLTEGVQNQPLILNIPQSAIANMQNVGLNKKQQVLTANAVPLLAEASIMQIFEPPHIPPSRSTGASKTTKKPSAGVQPVVIATKVKPGRTRIRSSTIVEKAPALESIDVDKKSSAEAMADDSKQTQFFVIGEEFGDTKLSRNAYRQILDYFNQNRVGRQLRDDSKVSTALPQTVDSFIPVQVIPEVVEPQNEETDVNKMTMKYSMDVENLKKKTVEAT